MSYIGKTPIVGNFQKCDAITVVNGQAAYTLQVSSTNVVPESANHMLVSLNGILQAPVTSFTVSGATLTFVSNLATGDVIDFVILLGNVLDLGTPSDGTVTNAKLAQDIISGETELAAIPDTTDEFLVSDAGVLKRIDAQFFQNTPSFRVYRTGNQSISLNTLTKVEWDAEDYDTDSDFASDKFTPQVAGKYYLYSNVYLANGSNATNTEYTAHLYKNGSSVVVTHIDHRTAGIGYQQSVPVTSVVTANGSSDYFEVYIYGNWGGGSINATSSSFFGGYKLIGA